MSQREAERLYRKVQSDADDSSARPLNDALAVERLRSDSIVRLDVYQRRLLHTFVMRWNATRAARGLAPKFAHEALTEGLESLIAMIGQE